MLIELQAEFEAHAKVLKREQEALDEMTKKVQQTQRNAKAISDGIELMVQRLWTPEEIKTAKELSALED